MVARDQARASIERLDAYVQARMLTGPDPYDGLLSPIAAKLHGRRPRQLLVQAVARAPIDLRPALKIPPVRMAKALALFVSGLRRVNDLDHAGSRRRELVEELKARRSAGGWGYEFDVQTRWAFYPAGSPNIIATSFVIEAFHDTDELTNVGETLRWFETRMLHPNGFIRYTPTSDHLIHNANVLGARALHRVAEGHPAVLRSVEQTVAGQRPDGTWPYGDAPGLAWVDNLHTAYVLFALADLTSVTPAVDVSVAQGLTAWTSRCFDDDGRARYYIDGSNRVDVHNVATALYTLARFAAVDSDCERLLPIVLDQLLDLQQADGSFVAGREPPYMRWNQAHAFRALAEVVGPDQVSSFSSPRGSRS